MKIGSLFSGTGGLDMGVSAVLDAEPAWFVEYDAAPSQILAHHWPEVHNYGDVTAINWASLPPVEIVTAGYPCQPFSTAGKRKGSTDERHLWPYVLEAIRQLRPRLVVLENVRGHLTLGFDRVLGDLAEAGYDTQWICLPASATGAPHRRERIFIVAHPADDGHERSGGAWNWRAGPEDNDQSVANTDHSARDGEWSRAESGQGDTPAADADRSGLGGVGRFESEQRDADGCGGADQLWGQYEPAIRRWESVLGRFAPAPTLPDGRSGNPRLSPAFVEWMMGLPIGHVTGTGIDRKAQLKALGNGVVPQQAALALSILLGTTSVDADPK